MRLDQDRAQRGLHRRAVGRAAGARRLCTASIRSASETGTPIWRSSAIMPSMAASMARPFGVRNMRPHRGRDETPKLIELRTERSWPGATAYARSHHDGGLSRRPGARAWTPGSAARADAGSVAEVAGLLSSVGYLADEHACSVLRLAGQLGKPVLVEGPTGSGKTDAGHQRGGRDRHQADQAAVLRGPGRGQGAVRVEPLQAAAPAAGRPGEPGRGTGRTWASSPRSSC